MENMLENFVKYVTNEQLDKMAQEDEVFCDYDSKLNELYGKFDEMKLCEENKRIIKELVETQVAQSARLTDLACRRATLEIVKFLKTMGILQDGAI